MDNRNIDAEEAVNTFIERGGDDAFVETVHSILLECDNLEVTPPYGLILEWVAGADEAWEVAEEWEEYRSIMSIR